jgi:hypothetical protein
LFISNIAIAHANDNAWSVPPIRLPIDEVHPFIACTTDELARLRAAVGKMESVDNLIAHAADFLDDTVEFPPRGGQHNQWYQCDKCQLGLKTLSPTRHQCPKCNQIYSGEPYDDVIFKRTHMKNFAGMTQCAWAYGITGKEPFARKAAEVMLGYAERYRKYPYHSAGRDPKSGWHKRAGGHIDEQTLGEAALMTRQVAPACDLIWDNLSDRERTQIRTGLIKPMLRNIDKNKAGKSNWQTWHNAAMLWGGAVIGEEEWVVKAITQPGNGFADQMKISVTDDGMWYENSWGYHFYTLSALVEIVEGARRLGIDLWSHPKLKRMFTLPVQYAMSGGELPRFGDDVNSSARQSGPRMEAAWHAYGDPAILALLDPAADNFSAILLGRKPSKSAPPMDTLQSEVFQGAGHAILRTQGPGELTAALTFGPYGGFHGHFDKLSFVFYGFRQELGVDPGRARSQAYRLPIHTDWYKATLSHNTVLVDQKSQRPATGKLECFAANNRYACVVSSCEDAYPGLSHRRLLLLTPVHLIVFDELNNTEGSSHQFDWVYHNRGSKMKCGHATAEVGTAGTAPGFEYIKDIRHGKSDDIIPIQIDDEKLTTHITINAHESTEFFTGDGPCASVLDRVPMTIVRRTGSKARFAVVIEPVRTGRSPAARSIVLAESSGKYTIEGNGIESITLTKDGRIDVRKGDRLVLAGAPATGSK